MERRELSPLADPVFKRVFGEEKDILMELINAVIGLEHLVIDIEYLPAEILPENTADKTTIVDVRCTDQIGRHFIVEMQVVKQKALQKRVFYNASRVYGRQINSGVDYEKLQPVYALCLVDHAIEEDSPQWKHKYILSREDDPKKRISEIEMHFIELSKCKKRDNFDMTNPLDRWIKFLIDPLYIKEKSMEKEYDYPNLKKAVALLDESNYTPGQLIAYDRYLDSIRSWNSSMKLSYEEGMDKGKEEGRLEGISEATQNLAQALKELIAGKSPEEVAEAYHFELSYIQQLFQELMGKN